MPKVKNLMLSMSLEVCISIIKYTVYETILKNETIRYATFLKAYF